MHLKRHLDLPQWYPAMIATDANVVFAEVGHAQWHALADARGPGGTLEWTLAMSGTRRAVALYVSGYGTTLIETPRDAFLKAWIRDGLALADLDALGEGAEVLLWCDNAIWRPNLMSGDDPDGLWQRNGRFARAPGGHPPGD